MEQANWVNLAFSLVLAEGIVGARSGVLCVLLCPWRHPNLDIGRKANGNTVWL
jgi:hypothetical protein